MQDSERLKEAFELSCDALKDALKMDEVDDRAKLAVQTISAYSKLKATERASQTLQYLVIKDFAEENGEELRKMVKASLPEFAPKLAELPG